MANGVTKSRVARVVAVLVLCAALIGTQLGAARARPKVNPDDLLYLPNERLLNHFTAGLSNVVADYLWVQCCTYVGREVKGDWNFQWLRVMLDAVVRLDPHFVPAYKFGGMFLASLKADDQAALDLLHKGMLQNPDAWELPYQAAMVYVFNRRDQPGAKEKAAFYLKLAVDTGHATKVVAEHAAALQSETNLDEMQREMWVKLAESDDALLSGLAKTKLDELQIKDNLKVLQELLEQFHTKTGAPAKNLDELVRAGLIASTPPDSHGGRYFVDVDGKPQNETLLNNAVRDHRTGLEAGIKKFKESHGGALPATLDEAATAVGMLSTAHPWPGKRWKYDPVDGSLVEEQSGDG